MLHDPHILCNLDSKCGRSVNQIWVCDLRFVVKCGLFEVFSIEFHIRFPFTWGEI